MTVSKFQYQNLVLKNDTIPIFGTERAIQYQFLVLKLFVFLFSFFLLLITIIDNIDNIIILLIIILFIILYRLCYVYE